MTVGQPTPAELYERLLDQFIHYFDTAYELREPGLRREVLDTLSIPGEVLQHPVLELLPIYALSPKSKAESLQSAGADPAIAGLLDAGLFPYPHLYQHQDDALQAVLAGENAVVTTGTGSGKTECFLIPIITRLAMESSTWPSESLGESAWWADGNRRWTPQRAGSAREDAMRAMILYPMNALVEDQLVRLRRSLDSSGARLWLDQHRGGNRFYFGRYTGQTPVSGRPTAKLAELRRTLKQADSDFQAIVGKYGRDSDQRFFMADPNGCESRSRWDMQSAPPDILITNYSMLNVMLMRRLEDPIFEKTRAWIERSPSNVFTLVIDELHMYRGTPGTEVAYLLRRLLDRLGLLSRPDQLSIIATTASIDPERAKDRDFLRGFFATPETFTPIRSTPGIPTTPTDAPLRPFVESVRASLEESPSSIEDLRTGHPDFDRLLQQALDEGHLRLRAHIFARNLPGLWACADPDCDKLAQEDEAKGWVTPSRRVGKVYTAPRSRCDCGSVVLDLLYCENCGESYLGGWRFSRDNAEQSVLSGHSNLDELPDRAFVSKTAGTYTIFWPASDDRPVVESWEMKAPRSSGSPDYELRYSKAELVPGAGLLRVGEPEPGEHRNGWVFLARAQNGDDGGSLPAFPTVCAHCGIDRESYVGRRAPEDRGRARSSIRTMGTGYEKANQIFNDALLRSFGAGDVGDSPKLIVFSDSRQDAARQSIGIEHSHYLDSVRQVAVERIRSEGPLAVAYDHEVLGLDRGSDGYDALDSLSPNDRRRLGEARRGTLTDEATRELERDVAESRRGSVTLLELGERVLQSLASLGANPAGPKRSLSRWTEAWDWRTDPPAISANPQADDLLRKVRRGALEETANSVFSGNGRDFEALGLGSAGLVTARSTIDGLPEDTAAQVLRSTVRLLGRHRRITDDQDDMRTSPPTGVRRYLERVAERHGMRYRDLRNEVESSISNGWRIGFSDVRLDPPTEEEWRCERCSQRHLHPSAGVCVFCGGPTAPRPFDPDANSENFYLWLSKQGSRVFRLHCAELTGQTDLDDARQRQALFQSMYLRGEEPLPQELDLLSVTTTMEAGVDIGALKAISMANMPPMRFNYQQRVGRAGRRDAALAVAFTLCRGTRSHDDHYFKNPDQMVAGELPQPYLDLRRRDILRRVAISEALRLAFRDLTDTDDDFDEGVNVHGQFGDIVDWQRHKTEIIAALERNLGEVRRVTSVLAVETELADEIDSILHEISGALGTLIDDAVADQPADAALSQTLAEQGLLPMFGFPTRERSLYCSRVSPAHRGPITDTISRDLGIAISEFAPGAEQVKDMATHRPIGLLAFERRMGAWHEVADPFGPEFDISSCLDCGYFLQSIFPNDLCPACGSREFVRCTVAQPLGFRTDFTPQDYDGTYETAGRAGTPRLESTTDPALAAYGGLLGQSAKGQIARFNLAGGGLYSFTKYHNWPGWIDSNLVGNDRYRDLDLPAPRTAVVDQRVRALGDRKFTDVLLLGAGDDPPPFVNLAPVGAARRGAWLSLGYLARRAIAVWQDVSPDELDVGLRVRLEGGQRVGEIFLADSLANGAGYCSFVGEQQNFERFGKEMVALGERWSDRSHHSCDSSCYDCLRDYRNQAAHSLLDWQLAVDLLNVLVERQQPGDAWRSRALALTEEFCSTFDGWEATESNGFALCVNARDRTALAIHHPLVEMRPEWTTDRTLDLYDDVAAMGYPLAGSGEPTGLHPVPLFDLERRPGWVEAQARSTGF